MHSGVVLPWLDGGNYDGMLMGERENYNLILIGKSL
jgi:hypothetical protein